MTNLCHHSNARSALFGGSWKISLKANKTPRDIGGVVDWYSSFLTPSALIEMENRYYLGDTRKITIKPSWWNQLSLETFDVCCPDNGSPLPRVSEFSWAIMYSGLPMKRNTLINH